MSNELSWFCIKLKDFKAGISDVEDIARCLSDSSPFVAFKRNMIRSNSELSEIFTEYI